MLLAAIGLYGVVAYSVSRRTREVGIRMALGAQRREVLRTMAARGARLAVAGLAIGAVLAAAAGTLLESMLYGVSGFDALALAPARVSCCWSPGSRISSPLRERAVDPVRALRSE